MEAQMVSHFKELDSCRMMMSRVDDLVQDTQFLWQLTDVNKPPGNREIISSLKKKNSQVSLPFPAKELG